MARIKGRLLIRKPKPLGKSKARLFILFIQVLRPYAALRL